MEKFTNSTEQREDSFEKQFSNRETIEVLDGKVEVVDIIPENLEKEIPVLFASGWGNTIKSYKDSMKIMSEKGRRVLGVEHARQGISENSLKNEQTDETKKYPIEELRKAFSILAVINKKNIEKIDVIAHSEGAINTAIAASIEPEKFSRIVFLNPAGMIGKDNFYTLTKRYISNNLKETKNNLFQQTDKTRKKRFANFAKEQITYIIKNVIRANNESKAISETDVRDLLKELKGLGIKIIVVAGVDDALYPIEKINAHTKAEGVDGFLSVLGGHIEMSMQPEKFVPAIDSLLSKEEINRDSN